MKTVLKASLIATAIASIPSSAFALGAGPINVMSGLGQPLRAEVPLTATAQELQTLVAKLAAPEAFRQANIPYAAALTSLRLSVDSAGSRPVLRISSDRPVNEPFLDLLLEFTWSTGRLTREYTFLLDPVDVAPTRSLAAPVQQSGVVSAPMPAAVAAQPVGTGRATAGGQAAADPENYQVRKGDTLHRIAEAHRPAGASLDQTLIALLRANPEAFDGGNINRMRAGAILRMPSAAEVQALTAGQARREVVAQAADFDAYRRRLAGTAATVAAAEESGQASGGRVTARVEEPVREDRDSDRVQVSRAPGGDPAQDSDQARAERLRALEEDLVARDRALTEANERVNELERSIHDLQKLIELKSEQLARLQQQSGGVPQAGASPGAQPEPSPAQAAPEAAKPDAEEAKPAEAAPAQPAAAAPAVEAAAAQPEQAKPAETPAPAKKPAAPRKPVAPPPPPPEPSFVEEMLGNPLVLGGGGILALLLGYAGIKLRQRRKPAEQDDSSLLMSEAPTGPNSVFGVTGGQSVDTASSSVLQTDFSQSGLASIDTDEGVDPVAEADVYMAYGRDAQAEEILVDALKADPNRTAIHLKLLEVYAARKNTKQFETIAAELYARTGGAGSDWAKAAEMGRALDPDNPLYHGDGQAPATQPAPSMPAATAAAATAAATAGLAGASAAPAVSDTDTLDVAMPGTADDAILDFELPDLDVMAEPELPPAAAADQASAPGAGGLQDTWAMPDEQLSFGESNLETPAAVVAPVAQPAVADDHALDFDLGLNIESDAQTQTDQAVFDPSATLIESLGFDIEESEPVQTPAAAPGKAEADLSATLVAPAGSFAEDTLVEGISALNAEPAAIDLEASSFDNSLLEFDLDIDKPATATPAPAPALDLSSIDLELDAPAELAAAPAAQEPMAADLAPLGEDFAPGGEVDTKLELARAYEEMGDHEGARELLEEVLREGSEAQQASARELLGKLA